MPDVLQVITFLYPSFIAQQGQAFTDQKLQVLHNVNFIVLLVELEDQDFHLLAVVFVAERDEVGQDKLQYRWLPSLVEVIEEHDHHVVQHRSWVGFAPEQGESLQRTAMAKLDISSDEGE